MTTINGKSAILSEIKALASVEHLIKTNEGTFGSGECLRKVGTGDTQYGTRKVYVTVGGESRETGPDEADAPGRMRTINAQSLADDRKRLANLRAQARAAE